MATLVGGGFLLFGAFSVWRGTFYDSDEGPIDRAERPMAFWLSVLGVTLLGLFILGVGYRWRIVAAIFELTGNTL